MGLRDKFILYKKNTGLYELKDYYTDEEAEHRLKLMEEIEDKMSVKRNYRLGYGQSEALVTMCRTPNNTFPVFWEEKGNMKLAPFPRR